ncbi:zinc-binding dehydrogenase [Arthrobacter sp. TMT4-20]
MKITAAIARNANQPLNIEQLEMRGPGPREVLVENRASGLCHTDLTSIQGGMGLPFPFVPGHEGAGVVVECGPEVTSVRPGDHVILANMAECGSCRACRSDRTNGCLETVRLRSESPPVFTDENGPVPSMTFAASFATHTVVPDIAVTKIPEDVPFEVAGLISCGVSTGVGAVRYTARVEEGSSVIVIGLGSIGLNVVQGARLAGATTIITLDTNPAREELARLLGATHFIDPRTVEGDLVQHLNTLTEGGADYAFECVGNVNLVQQAVASVNPYWGVCVAIGVSPFTDTIAINPSMFLLGRTLRGTFIGNVKPRTQMPSIVEDYRAGRLEIDRLVTKRLPLEDVNAGFEMMVNGTSVRSVVVH